MRKIKLTDKNFLENVSKLNDFDYEWITSTGKVFQDIQVWDDNLEGKWIGCDPKVVHKYLMARPERGVIFMLVGNCRKSYSRGQLKNCYIKVWEDER